MYATTNQTERRRAELLRSEYCRGLTEYGSGVGRNPESLFRMCVKRVVRSLDAVAVKTSDGRFALREGLCLPRVICEPLIEAYQSDVGEITDGFAHMFRDVSRTSLKSLDVRYSSITDDGLKYLVQHDLRKLTLANCEFLTSKSYANIMMHAGNLQSLVIGPNVKITPYHESSTNVLTPEDVPVKICEKAPKLNHLALRVEDPNSNYENIYLKSMLHKISNLCVLDLSCSWGVRDLGYLGNLDHLHTLSLFDVPFLREGKTISNICSLRSLVVLDISQSVLIEDFDQGENTVLASLMSSLPNLMSLDISGTNFDGEVTAESLADKKSDISGLECRVDNPLNFLGLYNTRYSACDRPNIPAKIITGNFSEEQLFNAATYCLDKPKIISIVLHDIFSMLQDGQCTQTYQAINTILKILTRYLKEGTIQLFGSWSILHIFEVLVNPLQLDDTIKKQIITTLLTVLDFNMYEAEIVCNIYFIFQYFNVPQDFMFEFNRFVHILLQMASNNHNINIQRGALHLLKLIASRVSFKQKIEFGSTHQYLIKKIIAILKDRLQNKWCDDVFELALFTLFYEVHNVPKYCLLFLNERGLLYIIEYLTTLSLMNTPHLVAKMMELLRNVAEVKELRHRLMRSRFIEVLSHLLFSTQNVSYNVVGIIANLASDGHSAWTIKSPSRDIMLNRVAETMKKWPRHADPNLFHFQFLDPVLQLVQVENSPQCVHWALWTLSNLTKLFSAKYCRLLVDKGFLTILNELSNKYHLEGHHGQKLGHLAKSVVIQCLEFRAQTVGLLIK